MGLFGKKKKAHTPVEAKESGRSKQRVKIVEILSEGEIEGLVDGLKSVRLDNTPIEAADGSHYFKNVEVEGRVGTQSQEVMAAFQAVEKEISVATEVTKRTALTRTVTDANVNRLRLTLGVQALFEQNNQGDTNPTTVELKITVGNQVIPFTIQGKYSSPYSRSIVVENLPKVPFTIKVERITADSASNRLANKTTWASYTEIIDGQFAYPNTAYMGVKFDSEYFNNIPIRTYEIDGMKVRVPSNYNPETRAYAGLWDGTFKVAYTNNPAWVLMDIVTNKRYGLGDRLGDFSVDKWALYQIAQYCDQMIPDGFGGTEPRFTCNLWLTEQRAAYDVLSDLCSIFRAMPVWNGTELTFIMDRPSDPVWTYTNANVVGGFSRQYSAMKARHNAIQVEYKDAENNYENTIEYVSDDEQIGKFGLNLRKVTAFGCTSRGQAFRTGKWILETERLETETVSFTVGAEGLMNIPGDIIRITDNHFSGTNIGGRVLAINGKQVTLDREINPEHYTANSYFTYINAQAKHQSVRISAVKGNQLTLADTPQGLTLHGIWSLSTQKVVSQLYRCMTITENSEDGTYTIVALQHEPQKEAIVDNGASFEPRQTSVLNTPTVESLNTETTPNGIKLNWATTAGIGTLTYDIKILKEGNLYAYHKGLSSTQFETDELPDGSYTVIIIAKNASGRIVSEKSKTFTIDRPPVPRDVRVLGGLGNITISWAWVDEATMTEIFTAETDDVTKAKRIAKVNAMFFSHEVGAKQVRYYWVRHTRGVNVGPFYQQSGLRGESSVDIDQELKLLNEKLSQNIVNEVFDTAAPARKLGMTLYVESLKDVNTYAGQKQVYDETANQMYTWNGSKYVPLETELLASKIKGIIEPSQLAAIPTTKLSGKLTDAQIQTLSATKLIGTLNIATVPNIPTNKLTGLLSLDLLPAVPVSKLSGKVAKNQLDNALIGELTTAQNTANAATELANTSKNKAEQAQSTLEQETANRIKAIQAEAKARSSALSAEAANRTKAIANESANLTAKIQAEAQTRGTAITQLQNSDKQQVQQITALTAKADNALSGLKEEQTARANADKAQAEKISTLTAKVDNAESTINEINQTIARDGQAMSQKISTLESNLKNIEVDVGGRNYLLNSATAGTSWNISPAAKTNWKGKKLTLSFDLTAENITKGGRNRIGLSFYLYYTDNTYTWVEAWLTNPPSEYKGRVKATIQLQDKEIKSIANCAFRNQAGGGTASAANPKLEVGAVATDWTPAPEDVEGDIAKVSANLTAYQATQATKDKAESDKVTALTTRMGAAEGKITNAEKSLSTLNSTTTTKFSQLEASLNSVKSDLGAKITAEQTARANGDKAEADEVKKLTASLNGATAQISTVSKAVADVNGKLTATHTIKTQAIAGSRTAIAGISLGANKEQSAVIVMADKFQVVKNAQDNAPKSMLSVVNNQMAINGDLIASGQITAAKLATNAVTAEKIAANAITSAKIAADAIESNKLKAGAVVAGKLAANAVVANNLAANAVTAEKIAAGAITAQKMSANSVGANAIQAGAIVAGKLAANSVDAGNIKAGAINANHISAGQISADKLAIGLGGNLLYNPIFANPTDGVPDGWRFGTTNTNLIAEKQCHQDADWGLQEGGYLPNENVVRYAQGVQAKGTEFMEIWQDVAVIGGQWYLFSCYLGNHRSEKITLYMQMWGANDKYLGVNQIDVNNAKNFGGIANATRSFLKTKMHNEAVKCRIFIRKFGTKAGQTIPSYMFVARPMLEECTEHTREPSPWQNAGVTAIHGGSIVTKTITAQQIAAGAVTANEIAAGAIAARHIAANSINANHIATKSITSEKLSVGSLSAISSDIGTVTAGTITGTTITGNNISGGSIWGTTISGTTISGTTIEGGTIKGARLEGATGKFTGELEVTQLIGGGVIEQVSGSLRYETSGRTYLGQEYGESSSSPRYSYYAIYAANVTINASSSDRYITFIGVDEPAFILPVHTSKTIRVARTETSSINTPNRKRDFKFMVLSYAISTAKTITIN